MNWTRLGVELALLLSGLVDIGLVYYAWRKRQKYAREFTLAMAAVTIYSFGYAGELTSNTLSQALLWSNIQYFGIPFIPCFLLLLFANYAGWQGIGRRLILTVAMGISTGVFLLHQTQSHHHWYYIDPQLVKDGPFMVLHFARGIGYWVFIGYTILTSLTVILLMFKMCRLTQPIYRRQWEIIIWAALIPWLANLAYLCNLGPRGLDVSALGFTVTGFLYVMGMSKFKLFDLVPIARERIFESIQDGVLVVDAGDRIVDYNSVAQELLPELNQRMIGQTVAVGLVAYAQLQQQIVNSVKQLEFKYHLPGDVAGQHWIRSRLSLLNARSTEIIGKILIVSDITQEKQTLAHLIQSEKVAALGRMVANVAHEINSPLAAIQATADNIDQSLEFFWRRLPVDYVNELTGAEQELFRGLLAKLEAAPSLTTREERRELQKLGVLTDDATETEIVDLARSFVKLGVVEDLPAFLAWGRETRKAQILRLSLEIAAQRRNVKRILQAGARTARIVYALNCYSHDSRDSAPVLTDLRAGLETVLQIYENVLKNGIKTVTHLPLVAPIPAFPDQLQQVWTNLIQNAVQALQGNGELQIDLEEDPEVVKVIFTDNGPGIDPEILPQIFEPFFTTKAIGEGSGLGLNICREIVARHQGTITVQSEPGRTRFTVCLPKRGDVQ